MQIKKVRGEALQNRLFAQYLRYQDFKILTYDQYAAVLKSFWPRS